MMEISHLIGVLATGDPFLETTLGIQKPTTRQSSTSMGDRLVLGVWLPHDLGAPIPLVPNHRE